MDNAARVSGGWLEARLSSHSVGLDIPLAEIYEFVVLFGCPETPISPATL